jgi:prepilin-type N-terminal cleavage/methylation domain-containing protein
MTQRKGFTLIEMLVVLSLLAVILPMAGGTVFFLLRAQSQSADDLRDSMALSQLSHAFRSDVHAARRARTAEGPAVDGGIVLELDPTRTIEYQAEPNGFVRRTVRRGKVVERREQFRVGGARPKFELADSGREVAVTILPRVRGSVSADGPTTQTSGIRIAAVAGRDLAGLDLTGQDLRLGGPTTPPKDKKIP